MDPIPMPWRCADDAELPYVVLNDPAATDHERWLAQRMAEQQDALQGSDDQSYRRSVVAIVAITFAAVAAIIWASA